MADFKSPLNNSPAITSEKLRGISNYKSWAASVRLWFKGQGQSDHLTKREDEINDKDKTDWVKADAQLCTLLWHSIDSQLLPSYQSCETCFDVWKKATKVYSNDIRRYYEVVSNLVGLKNKNVDIPTFVNLVETLRHEFQSLMPVATAAQDSEWDKFFTVMTLVNLRPELDHVRDQILAGASVPTLDDVLARLVRISSTTDVAAADQSRAAETSALVTQNPEKEHRQGRSGWSPRKRPQCTYCKRLGHTRDRCYSLHGRPQRANVALTPTDPNSERSITGMTMMSTCNFKLPNSLLLLLLLPRQGIRCLASLVPLQVHGLLILVLLNTCLVISICFLPFHTQLPIHL